MFTFKKTRRMIILTVFFILIVSSYSFGAKTNTNDPANIPVYEEQTFGEGFINAPNPIIRLNSKKQLVVYDSGNYSLLDLNGEPVRQIKPDFTGDGHIFAIGPQDNIYVLVQQRIEGQGKKETLRKLYIYSPKGEKLKSLDLGKAALKDGEPNFIWDMAIDSKGVIYVAINNEGLIVIGKDAKGPKDFRSGNYTTITVDAEDNLIVKGYKGSTYIPFIEKIRIPGGEVSWETKLDSGNWINRIFYNPTDKCIYALGLKRVDKYNSSGKLGGVVFDLYQNNLSGEGLTVDGLVVDPAQNIYLEVTQVETNQGKQTGSSSVKKFTPISSAKQDKNQKIITIAVPKSWGNFLENVSGIFQKKHPDYKVNIKEYVSGDSPEAYENYPKIINTEILAGKGADIIAVGSLPYKKYIDKNLFANLGDLMAKDKDINTNLDPVLIEACKYKVKLNVIAVNLNLPVLCANQTILDREGIKIDDRQWNLRDFLAIATKVTKDTNNDSINDQYALPKMDEKTIFYYIFQNAYNHFIDYDQKSARFDTPEFRELLNLCKSLKKLTNPQVDFMQFYQGEGQGSIIFYPNFINQYYDPIFIREQVFRDKIQLLSFPGSEKGISFSSDKLYAINNNSRFKNEAWELLKLMLSEELQNSQENYYLAASLATRKLRADDAMTKIDNINGKKISQMLTKEELKQVNGLLGRVSEYQYSDSQISKLVRDEVDKFFDGEKTAEEVGRIIQNKVDTYLNE